MRVPLKRIAVITAAAFFLHFGEASCEEEAQAGNLEGIEALIDLLRQKGIIDDQEARDLIDRSKQGARIEQEQAEKSKTELKEEVRNEVVEDLKEDVALQTRQELEEAVPEWTRRIVWGGDMRLRYEGDFFGCDNAVLLDPANPTEILNTQTGRNRFRYRARFGLKADVNEQVLLGLRLATGNIDDPVSTNQTLGDFLQNDNIAMELAYLRWKPLSEVIAWGGRFPNPWFHTNLLWDPDLNFEGAALQLNVPLVDRLRGFLTGGALPLQEVEFSKKDKWLFAGQGGMEWTPVRGLSARFGAAYYDFTNSVGIVNDPQQPGEADWTAPGYQQKGNTLMDIDPSSAIKTAYASDFNELDFLLQVDLSVFEPVHIVFEGDYVKNLGFDQQEVEERTGILGVAEGTDGFQIGLSVGHPKVRMLGTWRGFFYYRYLEADAVMDAFTESDFHLGGTNAKGWILGGEFGLMKNLWLSSRWLTSNEICGPPLAIDVFQFDLRAEF
jgi:hypothetical protein